MKAQMKARKMLVVAGTSAALWVGLPGTASATHCPPGATYPADCVHGGQQGRDGGGGAGNVVAPFADVRGAQVTRGGAGAGDRGGLPVTGGDVVGLTIMGLGAVGIGTLLVRRSHRIA